MPRALARFVRPEVVMSVARQRALREFVLCLNGQRTRAFVNLLPFG